MNHSEPSRPEDVLSESSCYQYRPLQQPRDIRLLKVTPVKSKTAIRPNETTHLDWELIHVDLDTAPAYRSISYAWGTVGERKSLTLINSENIYISPSLFAALRSVVEISIAECVYIWADQICIDQANVTERNAQVQLMGPIYAHARRTIIWLGDADEISKVAFEMIYLFAHISITLQRAQDMFYKNEIVFVRKQMNMWHMSSQELDAGTAALIQLSLRPWFTRLWTFQEFVLGSALEFFCGPERCSRYDLLRAFFLIRLLRNVRSTGMYHAACLWKYRILYLKGKPRHLLQLLSDISDSAYGCTEPHDRIFAVLALQSQHTDIPVDYDMPIDTLLYRTTKAIITQTRSLRILCRRRTGDRPNLPSWVADWTAPMFDWSIDDRRVGFAASKGFPYIFTETADRILLTRGKVVCTIMSIVPHSFNHAFAEHAKDEDLDHHLGSDMLIRTLSAQLQADHSRITHLPKAETPSKESDHARNQIHTNGHPQAVCAPDTAPDLASHVTWLLAMTLTGGRFRNAQKHEFRLDSPSQPFPSSPTNHSSPLTSSPGDRTSPPPTLASLLRTRSVSDARALGKCKGRRVAMLDAATPTATTGPCVSVALVPEYARTGDRICVLNGCATPLVLRPHDNEQEWEVLGECYVQGIMYGEAVDWEEGGGDEIRIR